MSIGLWNKIKARPAGRTLETPLCRKSRFTPLAICGSPAGGMKKRLHPDDVTALLLFFYMKVYINYITDNFVPFALGVREYSKSMLFLIAPFACSPNALYLSTIPLSSSLRNDGIASWRPKR